MELELISKEKNLVEFYIKGERHTLPALLKSRLEADKSVEFVSYKLDHPLENKSRFVVRGKDPKGSIEDACSQIIKETGEFSEKLKKLK